MIHNFYKPYYRQICLCLLYTQIIGVIKVNFCNLQTEYINGYKYKLQM